MNGITAIEGIKVGNAQDQEGGSGCTVVLCEEGAVCGVDVRGGAPGTRETDCLDPVNFVQEVHAVYLGGGSAYGLAGADGVMAYLEEKGCGLDVGGGVVPLVPGAVLFDLPVADFSCRPDRHMGYKACLAAQGGEIPQGNVGAGMGATVGKAGGLNRIMKGGLGSAVRHWGGLTVGALVAVNCFGDVIDPADGTLLAGTRSSDGKSIEGTVKVLADSIRTGVDPLKSNTTLGVIATNAALTKTQATKIAQMTHDGFARAINPIHTLYDGDTIFCLSKGKETADLSVLGAMAAEVMAEAIANGVRSARSVFDIPASSDLIQGGL